MTFAYYSRLSRAQQAIYRKSDGVADIRLPRPELLHPLVEDVASALAAESREQTWEASDRLLRGLAQELGVPPVKLEVLAARPHRRWGELHGLYTAEPGRTPKIQLWMRTAKQRRVVAFRTYLRTLLHELGHHLDYTMLRLHDSFHTEGFYKRESSLFHQLVPAGRIAMPTVEEYAKQPVALRLGRLERTADELVSALQGQPESALARRPDPKNWAAKEIVCHLRDTEELFSGRLQLILQNDEPTLLTFSQDTPDRWAEERQYQRSEVQGVLAAFRRRREETLATLKKLNPESWQRGGIHPTLGRVTAEDILSRMAWHDDNHLDQLKRALEGKA